MSDTFQQPKITGYRQLAPIDAEMMNKIKAHGEVTKALIEEVRAHINKQRVSTKMQAVEVADIERMEAERMRLDQAEPERWALFGESQLQLGLMSLTRAVAQPSSF